MLSHKIKAVKYYSSFDGDNMYKSIYAIELSNKVKTAMRKLWISACDIQV